MISTTRVHIGSMKKQLYCDLKNLFHGVHEAVVPYGDAFLGTGTVPTFCAHRRREARAQRGHGAGAGGAVVPAGRARCQVGGG